MYCPTGKVRHKDKSEAKIHLRRMYSKGSKGKLRAFRCVLCGFWHIGHDKGDLTRQDHRDHAVRMYAV